MYLQKVYNGNTNTVSLYANIIQKVLDALGESDTIISDGIQQILEQDKTYALSGHTHSLFKVKNLQKTNPSVRKFGLIPVTDSMLLPDLLKVILIGHKAVKSTDLNKLGKSLGVGFIVFNRVVFTPIEYNIRALIINKTADPLIQPDTYGPTEKMVTRFKTIRDYPRQKKWDFSASIHNASAGLFYVIETLDGKHYRCLYNKMPDQEKTFGIDKQHLLTLINHISHNKTEPSRAAEYQAIAVKKSTPNMFLPKPLEIDSLGEKMDTIPSHAIKQDTSFELNKLLNDILRIDFSNDLRSNSDINAVLHDTRFGDVFYQAVLTRYQKSVKLEDIANYTAGHFPFSELLSSFMTDLQSTTRRFVKELHDGYGRDPLKNTVFGLPKTERMFIIKKKLEDVIESALNLSIKADSNIYAAMYHKYMVLNYT